MTKVLEQLVHLLAAKKEDEASSEEGRQPNPRGEVQYKLELMPNEIKLEGVGNYLSWSRRGMLILRTKSIEGYVLGAVNEPEDKLGQEWRKWNATDSLILTWLLNSLTLAVAASVEALATSMEVWDALSKMYSGKGNVMLISQIEDTIHDLKQDDKTLMTYVGELKYAWADLDHLAPLVLSHSECVAAAKKWIEDRRVLKFLKGLHRSFEGRRAALMHLPQLPTLEEAIAAMGQEETRLKQVEKGEVVSKPAYYVSKRPENRDCHTCGIRGHLSYDCTAPRRGQGRGYSRGNYRGTRGRNTGYSNYQGGARANMSVMDEGPSQASSGQNGMKKGDQATDTSFRQFAHFVYTDEGKTECASLATHRLNSDWILDSGASKHVAGCIGEFESYKQFPSMHQETIQTADGTAQKIEGTGIVQCTRNIKLSSVLHVPAFPVNLLSLSALVDQIDCRVIVDRYVFSIQERLSGRKIGTGTRRRGLWYMDRDEPGKLGGSALVAALVGKEKFAMVHHCRMGHVAFDKMSKAFPDVMSEVDKNNLKCEACEYAKHTRTIYVSKGLRNISPFMLVHSDVWTCPISSISGMKYFVTFIDCYSRMTWVYLMKHKDEVLACFQNFYAYVKTQFKVQVYMLRSDNGTEYINKKFAGMKTSH